MIDTMHCCTVSLRTNCQPAARGTEYDNPPGPAWVVLLCHVSMMLGGD